MLKDLQWDTFEERRKRNRLFSFYKIRNGQTRIDTRKYLTTLGCKSRHANGQVYKTVYIYSLYTYTVFNFLCFQEQYKRMERTTQRNSLYNLAQNIWRSFVIFPCPFPRNVLLILVLCWPNLQESSSSFRWRQIKVVNGTTIIKSKL